MKRGKPHKQET